MKNILEHFKSTIADAHAGWNIQDTSFTHEFGTEQDSEVWYEAPEIEPFEVRMPTLPCESMFDPDIQLNNKTDLMKHLMEIFEEIFRINSNFGVLVLVPGFQIIQDFGSEPDENPVEYLKITGEWQEPEE